MSLPLSRLGEEGLIRRIARGIRPGPSVLKGIGDDCAVLRGPGRGRLLLFACDMLVEGTHFTRRMPAEGIGWKALAVNVSDVAAMAGLPRQAVVSLGLPRSTPLRFVDGLYRGLRRCAREYHVELVGGDTVRAPQVVVDVAILGEVEEDRTLLRSGARPGDVLMVTGRLGGSLAGGRHLWFRPRVQEARALAARSRLHAMLDLSDGLGQDLARLCEASGVSAVLEPARIPRCRGVPLEGALWDGEDFELLIAAAPADAERLLRWARRGLRCGLTRVGRVVRKEGAAVRGDTPDRGFRHF